MIRPLLLAVLLLAGCSSIMGGTPWHASEIPRRTNSACVVDWYEDADENAGITFMYQDRPQEVYIKTGNDYNKIRRVVCHEFLHVVGYSQHIPDEDCYFRAYAGSDLGPFCPQEVRKIRMVSGRWRIYCLAPGLIKACKYAIGRWNEAAGREVFSYAGSDLD